MKLVSWSIINNEIAFLPDLVDYHLQFVDQMYFLDTGSKDGSLKYLLERSKQDTRIVVETYHTSYSTRYDLDWLDVEFPEVDVRNYALSQAEKLGSNWLIQLDGDEVYLPETREIVEQSSVYAVIAHSTINPVTKLEYHPKERRGGKILWDPHARIWKTGKGFKFIANPAFPGKQCHCIPVWNDRKHLYSHPLIYFTDRPVHYHLHWMYGPKVEQYYAAKDILDKQQILTDQFENQFSSNLPELFWQRRKDWINK